LPEIVLKEKIGGLGWYPCSPGVELRDLPAVPFRGKKKPSGTAAEDGALNNESRGLKELRHTIPDEESAY